MKRLRHKTEGRLRVIDCTLPGNQELSFIANEKRILCLRKRPSKVWESTGSDNAGIAAAVNRFGR